MTPIVVCSLRMWNERLIALVFLREDELTALNAFAQGFFIRGRMAGAVKG